MQIAEQKLYPSSTDVGSHVSRKVVSLLEVLTTHLFRGRMFYHPDWWNCACSFLQWKGAHLDEMERNLTAQSVGVSFSLKTASLLFAVVAPHVKNCKIVQTIIILSEVCVQRGCVPTLPRSEVIRKVSLHLAQVLLAGRLLAGVRLKVNILS